MFVQIIQGRTKDAAGLRKQFEHGPQQLPDDSGFLGATGGITDDGEFFAAVRFASEEHARRNSQRPEQDAWWQETAGYFDGEVTFHDCTQVDEWMDGPWADAGFVQVIQSTVSHPARYREVMSSGDDAAMAEHRPDIIGGIAAWHGDGGVSEVIYFTDEASAREGEKKEMPPEMAEGMQEARSLSSGTRFLDLRDPIHMTA